MDFFRVFITAPISLIVLFLLAKLMGNNAVHFGRGGERVMKLNLDRFTAAQLAAHVAAGDFSATEVAQASLEAIEAREGGVQAFLQVAPELALEAAARVDADRAAGKPLPPLAGVPLAIKDNMNLVGTRTTCASRMLEDYQSVYTATCVQRIYEQHDGRLRRCL